MERLPGPIYRTWGEAMADPDFDPTRPWYVANPDAPPVDNSDAGWTGWTEVGATSDIP